MQFRPVVLVCLVAASSGSAQDFAPVPGSVRSVEVIDDGAVIHTAADGAAKRRGTVAAGTRLPYLGRVRGTGCSTGEWIKVEARGYVCSRYLRLSSEAPAGRDLPHVEPNALLPHNYAFVAYDATRAYMHPSDLDLDNYVEAYGEGFGLIIAEQVWYDGQRFAKTRKGLYVLRSSLRPAQGSGFVGMRLEDGSPLDFAWVTRQRARVHQRPRGRVTARVSHRDIVRVAEEVRSGWVRLVDGGFMRDRDLARVRQAERPGSTDPDERWIDVDVEEQVLTAYRGDRAVYATLISSGRPGRQVETPKGEFRIWVKLAFSDMDDLEREDVARNYAIEQVPWVQYFEGSNGLHAAFWHDEFGSRRSHGCVNLSPRDARWVFDFTLPALPSGWYAIIPTDQDPGTLVRIR